MPSIPVLWTLLREAVTLNQVPREPEPDLAMDDPDKVQAFIEAGRVDGIMASVYLFHTAQVCEVIKPGDTVVDLGCGPANQLAMIAQLNPKCEFLGVDLSDEMLDRARAHVGKLGLTNVRFEKADMSKPDFLGDASVDAVISTVALHHFPGAEQGAEAFNRTFAEIGRILRNDGGIYVVDFGRLKSAKSINYFAYQHADREPELFTLDYLYSLKAAFTSNEFRQAARRHLDGRAEVFATFIAPFMVAVKSPSRRDIPSEITERLNEIRRGLPQHIQVDLDDLVSWFRMGGLRTRALS